MSSLADQALLARIAKNDLDPNVGAVAVGKLTSLLSLIDVARNAVNFGVQTTAARAALYRAFFGEGSSSVDARVVKFLEKIDQRVWAEVAKNDDSTDIASEAARKLNDQALLTQLAKDGRFESVRLIAVHKIVDQHFLVELANSGNDPSVGALAVGRIADQSLLAQVVRTTGHAAFLASAIERIVDQSQLAEIARTDARGSVRLAAAKRLEVQQDLGELAISDVSDKVRVMAVLRLRDQRILNHVAKNVEDENVRRIAVRKGSGNAQSFRVRIELPEVTPELELWKKLKNWLEPEFGEVDTMRTIKLNKSYPGHPEARGLHSAVCGVLTIDPESTLDRIWEFLVSDEFIYDFKRLFKNATLEEICELSFKPDDGFYPI